MKKIILFAVSFLGVSAAWAQQAPVAAPGASTEAINADNVPIEEYVPKVIIEGKWGVGPGEFGVAWTYASDVNSPQDESGEIPPIFPSSLAVDSKGDIYVLDTVNNRIQKFNTSGEYLKSIEVESYNGKEQPIWYGKIKTSDGKYVLDRVLDKTKQGSIVGVDKWFPFYWPITVEGINIVIDSKDTLYYYLKRIKNGEESGEVWEFMGDKVVGKSKKDAKDIDDPKNPRAIPYSQHPARNWIQADIKQEVNGNFLVTEKEGKRGLKIKLQANEKLPGYAIYDKKEKIWKIGVKAKSKFWHQIYNESGKLVKISEVPELSEFSDSKGSYYYLQTGKNSLVVKKSELVRLK